MAHLASTQHIQLIGDRVAARAGDLGAVDQVGLHADDVFRAVRRLLADTAP